MQRKNPSEATALTVRVCFLRGDRIFADLHQTEQTCRDNQTYRLYSVTLRGLRGDSVKQGRKWTLEICRWYFYIQSKLVNTELLALTEQFPLFTRKLCSNTKLLTLRENISGSQRKTMQWWWFNTVDLTRCQRPQNHRQKPQTNHVSDGTVTVLTSTLGYWCQSWELSEVFSLQFHQCVWVFLDHCSSVFCF